MGGGRNGSPANIGRTAAVEEGPDDPDEEALGLVHASGKPRYSAGARYYEPPAQNSYTGRDMVCALSCGFLTGALIAAAFGAGILVATGGVSGTGTAAAASVTVQPSSQ